MLNDPQDPEVSRTLERLLALGALDEATDAGRIARRWVRQGYDSVSPIELVLLVRAIRPRLADARCQVCRAPIGFQELPAYLRDEDGRCGKHQPARYGFDRPEVPA